MNAVNRLFFTCVIWSVWPACPETVIGPAGINIEESKRQNSSARKGRREYVIVSRVG